ncbi:hypothetical protein GCM10018966_006300 [Streptomyces yanii]
MHCIGVGVGVEDENGPARIAGCPEGVQVAQIDVNLDRGYDSGNRRPTTKRLK